jgi:hypothetical protein
MYNLENCLIDYTFIKPNDFCPKKGPQTKLKGTKLSGSCIVWSMWYTEQRLLHPDKEKSKIINEILEKSDQDAYKLIEKYIKRLNKEKIIVNDIIQKRIDNYPKGKKVIFKK